MKVGFTGTRNGMTRSQYQAFMDVMWELKPKGFRHGACKGADTEAVQCVAVMSHFPVFITAHPGVSARGGDNEFLSPEALKASKDVLPAKPHFARNRDIVNLSEVVVGTPWQDARPAARSGGGTWFTIQYAEQRGVPTIVIWPDGHVTRSPRLNPVTEKIDAP